jgi:hypothetical protein
MSERQSSVRVLRITLALTALFDLLAMLVLVHGTPIAFTAFMFIGQPLFVVSVILLAGTIVVDLKTKGLL